ncbi:DNA topoisomerase II [Pantoea phage Phynn]|nr:DNA topoisomerase II [Pantoea phage Phynn]
MKKNISDYIRNEALEYALYTINSRAIPHMIDGFKPVHRYFVYSALRGGAGFQKVAAVGGAVAMYGYHHGEGSAEDSGSLLAAGWCNNLPLFDRDGFFGSRLVKKPGAGRYIKCRVSSIFKAIYRDEELAPVHPDPDHLPPAHYLPIIPMVLVNGFTGIAKAHATDIPPHCPISVLQGCIAHLKGKPFSLELKYPDFRGVIEDGVIKGTYQLQGKTKLLITEIPPKYDREGYMTLLSKLKLKGDVVSYKDRSKDNFLFEVALKREYANTLKPEKIMKDFGLLENVTPNLNVINEGVLISYDSTEKLLSDFVDIRIGYYQKRIDKRIAETKEAISKAEAKYAFISYLVEHPDALKGKSRAESVKFIAGLDKCENHAEMLVQMNIYHLTTDELQKLLDDLTRLREELKHWETTTPKVEYLADLVDLNKKLK